MVVLKVWYEIVLSDSLAAEVVVRESHYVIKPVCRRWPEDIGRRQYHDMILHIHREVRHTLVQIELRREEIAVTAHNPHSIIIAGGRVILECEIHMKGLRMTVDVATAHIGAGHIIFRIKRDTLSLDRTFREQIRHHSRRLGYREIRMACRNLQSASRLEVLGSKPGSIHNIPGASILSFQCDFPAVGCQSQLNSFKIRSSRLADRNGWIQPYDRGISRHGQSPHVDISRIIFGKYRGEIVLTRNRRKKQQKHHIYLMSHCLNFKV